MSKCLVLFVEGDTEVEFYKQVVANARKLHPAGRFDTNIEYRNVRGVGGFKSIALRKFTKEIKPKYGDELSCIKRVNVCILRQMVSHDIVKNTVYAKDRSKCLPLADDGAGYK